MIFFFIYFVFKKKIISQNKPYLLLPLLLWFTLIYGIWTIGVVIFYSFREKRIEDSNHNKEAYDKDLVLSLMFFDAVVIVISGNAMDISHVH